MKRDWLQAVAKRDAEGACCRVCGKYPAEMAHVIGRKHDRRVGGKVVVNPDSIVPLCGPFPQGCHGAYDLGDLDLLPHLTVAEQAQAVEDAGGIVAALRRVSGRQAGEMAA